MFKVGFKDNLYLPKEPKHHIQNVAYFGDVYDSFSFNTQGKSLEENPFRFCFSFSVFLAQTTLDYVDFTFLLGCALLMFFKDVMGLNESFSFKRYPN